MSRITFLYSLIPFGAFFAGYLMIDQVSKPVPVTVPSVIGRSIAQAVALLSEHQLSARIIAQQYTNTQKPGIVLEQRPTPSSHIKSQQSVFLVVSAAPEAPRAPDVRGLTPDEARARCQEQPNPSGLMPTVSLHIYYLPSPGSSGHIWAQTPAPGAPAPQGVVAYCAQPLPALRLMPDLRGRTVAHLRNWCQKNGCTAEIIPQYADDEELIVEQRPMPGTIVDWGHTVIIHAGVPSQIHRQPMRTSFFDW